jgi:hypothetical protein
MLHTIHDRHQYLTTLYQKVPLRSSKSSEYLCCCIFRISCKPRLSEITGETTSSNEPSVEADPPLGPSRKLVFGATTSLKPNSKSWSVFEVKRCFCMHSYLGVYLHLGECFVSLRIARHSSPVVVQQKVKRSPKRVIRASFDQLDDIVVDTLGT